MAEDPMMGEKRAMITSAKDEMDTMSGITVDMDMREKRDVMPKAEMMPKEMLMPGMGKGKGMKRDVMEGDGMMKGDTMMKGDVGGMMTGVEEGNMMNNMDHTMMRSEMGMSKGVMGKGMKDMDMRKRGMEKEDMMMMMMEKEMGMNVDV
jgi:hypothetical protein